RCRFTSSIRLAGACVSLQHQVWPGAAVHSSIRLAALAVPAFRLGRALPFTQHQVGSALPFTPASGWRASPFLLKQRILKAQTGVASFRLRLRLVTKFFSHAPRLHDLSRRRNGLRNVQIIAHYNGYYRELWLL
uniref:Integron gene cassette protein n=1 Tax=Macrostomum lignano TaxID=282301 RepID=A0A1I8FL77_9PLAT